MRAYARLFSSALMVAAVAWGCGDSSGPTFQLVQNGGFETGDLTAWATDNSGAGQFAVLSDTVGNGLNLVILPPPESTFAAVSIQNGPGSNVMYQDVFLPAGARIRFQATVYVTSQADFVDPGALSVGTAPNQQFRVDVIDPAAPLRDVGAGVLWALYQTMPGDSVWSGYIRLDADLTAFAGRTVRLRFVEVDTRGFLHAAVDGVSVTAR